MAWVRVHDGAMSHPKVVGLIDWKNPFCLWIWGLSYCQLHLTDGWIPKAAIPNPTAMKTSVRLLAARLWEDTNGSFCVHHYLDWNDARELVTKKRTEAKTRMQQARERSSQHVLKRSSREVRENFYVDRGVSSGSSGSLERESERKPLHDPMLDPLITERAGRFIERYERLYVIHRKGARYAVKPHKDFAAAVTLCATWDDARLDQLAVVFLNSDHSFAESGSRTVSQFLAMASWCDGKLSEVEAAGGPK